MRRDGFTLIELLIVVAIIGILAAIAVPNFLNAQIRAKVAKTEAEMRTFVTANEMYKLDNADYIPHNHTPWQNKYLTTPISYVATPPKDIFQSSTNQQDTPAQRAWNLSFGEYHLERVYYPDGTLWLDPNLRVPNNPADVQRALSGKPWSYELWSIGPNRRLDHNIAGSGIVGFIYYMPSNGTDSVGDIVWIRP
ncbi:MAG: prepilin-type N-terminal cleavage/methylation domain-containing protein [bacterium]